MARSYCKRGSGESKYFRKVSKHGTIYNTCTKERKKELAKAAEIRAAYAKVYIDRFTGEVIPPSHFLPNTVTHSIDKNEVRKLGYRRKLKISHRYFLLTRNSLQEHPFSFRAPRTLVTLLRAHAELRDISFSKLVNDILTIWLYEATPAQALDYFTNKNTPGLKVGLIKNTEVPRDGLGRPRDYRLPPFPRDAPSGYLASIGYSKDPPMDNITKWLQWSVDEDKKKKMPS